MSIARLLLSLGCLLLPAIVSAQNDPNEMAAARAALKHSHGNHLGSLLMAERLEVQNNNGEAAIAFEGQGWIGGDIQKLWLKVDAEQETGESRVEEFEIQALYSRAISPFWDVQTGIRHDVRPAPQRSYATIGFQGLAPYWFEIDSALFVSERGDVSVRMEAEYEFRLSQRVLLQPRIEANVAFSDDDELGITSGKLELASGLRLRYEVTPRIAPYVGVRWQGAVGSSAREHSQDKSSDPFSLVAGVRFWF